MLPASKRARGCCQHHNGTSVVPRPKVLAEVDTLWVMIRVWIRLPLYTVSLVSEDNFLGMQGARKSRGERNLLSFGTLPSIACPWGGARPYDGTVAPSCLWAGFPGPLSAGAAVTASGSTGPAPAASAGPARPSSKSDTRYEVVNYFLRISPFFQSEDVILIFFFIITRLNYL